MKLISKHKVLVHGETFEHCKTQTLRFFDLTSLVVYDRIVISKEQSVSGLEPHFWSTLNNARDRNADIVAELINDLQQNGVITLQDVKKIELGYVSKTFHILSHFIDGFIGIDSHFYNLLEDSHGLREETAALIRQTSDEYWILHLDCFAAVPGEAGLLHK